MSSPGWVVSDYIFQAFWPKPMIIPRSVRCTDAGVLCFEQYYSYPFHVYLLPPHRTSPMIRPIAPTTPTALT